MLAYLLLGVAQFVGLSMIPGGLPGIWLQLAAVALFGWWSGFGEIGITPLLILAGLVLCAELTERVVGGHRGEPALRRRFASAALVGGIGGAFVSYWLPMVGSLFGAVGGAIIGGIVGFARARQAGAETRGSGGALVGVMMKVSAGVAVAVFSVLIVLSGVV